MAKRSKAPKTAKTPAQPAVVETPIVAIEAAEQAAVEAALAVEDDAEILADIGRKHSVVKTKYKTRYLLRARENPADHHRKAQKRSAWDWLAEQLAGECLNSKAKIDIAKFTRILQLNGVDYSRWTNRSKGWEGRFRMTGRLALQRIVAETGKLVVEGDELQAPAEWVAKYKN